MANLIIRHSREVNHLYLIQSIEKVYRVILNNIEKFNGLDYDEASNYYNSIESGIL